MIENKGEIATIIVEPIRNYKPDNEFLDGLREIAYENKSVLIVDEISSGFRMNTGGAHLILGLEPDIAVFSKALGNGYPMAAIIGKGEFMNAAQTTFISSTYWTERIGPSAAIAMIRKHKKVDAGSHLMKIGERIQEGWREHAVKHNMDISVRGLPPLSHFSFDHSEANVMKALFIQTMLEKGYLASNVFYAMYAHKNEHVDSYLKAVDETFNQISEWEKEGNLNMMLAGSPSVSGFKRLN